MKLKGGFLYVVLSVWAHRKWPRWWDGRQEQKLEWRYCEDLPWDNGCCDIVFCHQTRVLLSYIPGTTLLMGCQHQTQAKSCSASTGVMLQRHYQSPLISDHAGGGVEPLTEDLPNHAGSGLATPWSACAICHGRWLKWGRIFASRHWHPLETILNVNCSLELSPGFRFLLLQKHHFCPQKCLADAS